MTEYLFSRSVEGDLREICDRIGRDNPASARRMMVRFVNALRLLARRPELGHVRKDLLQDPAIRFWPVGACGIVYPGTRTPIEILAVVHGARDVPAIMNRRAQ